MFGLIDADAIVRLDDPKVEVRELGAFFLGDGEELVEAIKEPVEEGGCRLNTEEIVG